MTKSYYPTRANTLALRGAYHELDKLGQVTISKVFTFTKQELLSFFDENNENEPIEFKVALRDGEYFCFPKNILSLEHDLYIHKDIKLERKLFVAERGISIFPKIDRMVTGSLYLGGTEENAIPTSIYYDLLKAFPNTYELNRYASARISSILSSYIDTEEDYEEQYQKYLNSKVSKKGANLQFRFSELEMLKYKDLLGKLNSMLDDEISYGGGSVARRIVANNIALVPEIHTCFQRSTCLRYI